MTAPRVYLAGPDVFLPDPQATADKLKKLCEQRGLIGVFPLDSKVEVKRLDIKTAHEIAQANEDLIRGCDAVLANLTPFRGPSADVGTVFEIGFARALGKPVFGYTTSTTPFGARSRQFLGLHPSQERDPEGMLIEDFGCVDNLMIDGGIHRSGGQIFCSENTDELLTSCISALARLLQNRD